MNQEKKDQIVCPEVQPWPELDLHFKMVCATIFYHLIIAAVMAKVRHYACKV